MRKSRTFGSARGTPARGVSTQPFDANAEGTAPLTTGKTGKGGMLDE